MKNYLQKPIIEKIEVNQLNIKILQLYFKIITLLTLDFFN